MRAIFPKCAWLIGLIIPFARCENKKHQKKRIHNIFLPLAPVPSNVKVRMSGLRVPARARLHAGHSVRYLPQISPPTCVPIAAAGDSGHTFLQPTLSCSPSVARQTLVTGNQVRSHCRLQVTISIRTQPSHQLRRGWGMVA